MNENNESEFLCSTNKLDRPNRNNWKTGETEMWCEKWELGTCYTPALYEPSGSWDNFKVTLELDTP